MVWTIITNVASLLTILGVSFTSLVTDPWKAWVALAIFTALAAYTFWTVFRVGRAAMNRRYPRGYLPLSSAARFTTADGRMATYEVFRHIQIKQPVMKNFDHKFGWSGTKDPVVSSDIQTCSEVRPIEGEGRKVVRLSFPRAKIYNDVEIIHIKMNLDDSDDRAEPYLSLRVDEPIRLISFRVELLHHNGRYIGQHATVTKTATSTTAPIPEQIATVAFDATTKSFYFQAVDPEPGYAYKIMWPKHAPAAARGRRKGG